LMLRVPAAAGPSAPAAAADACCLLTL
jgi:hypothetical protein